MFCLGDSTVDLELKLLTSTAMSAWCVSEQPYSLQTAVNSRWLLQVAKKERPGAVNLWVIGEYPLWVSLRNCRKSNREQHTWKWIVNEYIIAAVTELILP